MAAENFFFSKQLMAALKIMDKGYVSKNHRLKGSLAGAMGQTQFMCPPLIYNKL